MSATYARDHDINSVGFDKLIQIDFPVITLAATQVSGTIQARRAIATCYKIYRVIAALSGSVAGTASINIAMGTAALTGTLPIPDTGYAGQPTSGNTPDNAYPPAYATNGQQLFYAARAITMTADAPTVITPNDAAPTSGSGAYAIGTPGFAYDSLWGPGGSLLTVRLVTNGSAAGTLNVSLLVKPYDPFYNKPVLTGFNPATDIP